MSGVLTGDFSKAWDGAKQVALGAMRGMVTIYNETIARLPGVAEIDMARIERAMGQVGETAQDELKPALVDTAEATDDLTVSDTQEFSGGCY